MLHSCFRLMAAALVIAGSLSAVRPASAVAIYDYAGNPFTLAVPPYTTSMFVTATVTLDAPLPDGLSLSDITGLPGGFSLTTSDQVRTLSTTDPLVFAQFQVTTEGGSIVEWVVSNQIIGDHAISTQSVRPPTPFVTIDRVTNVATASTLAFVFDSPGPWTLRAVAVPVPTTAILLATGMVGLGLAASGRRRAGVRGRD
jgi:hypothetical protein